MDKIFNCIKSIFLIINLIYLRNKKKYIYIIKIFNLLIFFSIYIINNFNNVSIYKIQNFENSKKIEEKEIKYFRTINNNNILLDNKKYNRSEYPDISIILSVYNQDHCIHKAFRSIQNQSIKNIEIIVIDDCSSDNSVKIVESFQKNDNRIIILKHKKNEGKIKTRTEGIRIAKGKYITILDGDDTFIHSDILYDSLYIAYLANLDIVEFKASIDGNINQIVNEYYKNNKIIYQPELKKKFVVIKDDDSFCPIISRSICFKLIKNEILQKVVDIIGPKYTEEFMLNYEDTIMSYILFKVANSYYLMKEIGYYYSRKDKKQKLNLKNECLCTNNNINTNDSIKFIYFLFERTKNNKQERKMLCHEIIAINYYLNITQMINSDFYYPLKIIEILIKSKYLSKIEKEKLINIYNNIKKKYNDIK